MCDETRQTPVVILTLLTLTGVVPSLYSQTTMPDTLASGHDQTTFEAIPILSYDTDVGVGLGAKAFLLNALGHTESFDVVLFNSTKGERWYRLVASVPDLEQRQGTEYSFSVDLVVDYDTFLQNLYFGVGPDSHSADRETYKKEPLELSVIVGRGLTATTVLQAAIRARWIRNAEMSDTGRLRLHPVPLSTSTARALTVLLSYRYDSRDSYIDPASGLVFQGDLETTIERASNTSWTLIGGAFHYYHPLADSFATVAFRLAGRSLSGNDIPVQFLLPLGGNQTLRGFPQDRFLDRTILFCNAEARIPVYWRLSCVLGVDAGGVSPSPGLLKAASWRTNAVIGVRLALKTFIIRADLGLSSESTGFFLNFGQLF